MDPLDFFELCNIGDDQTVKQILENRLVDVNFQHRINGWTALHWACRRGHKTIVQLLLTHGADPHLIDNQGRRPIAVTNDQSIIALLGGKNETEQKASENAEAKALPIVPNYLRNPPFVYAKSPSRPRHVSTSPKSGEETGSRCSGSLLTIVCAGGCLLGLIAVGVLVRHRLMR